MSTKEMPLQEAVDVSSVGGATEVTKGKVQHQPLEVQGAANAQLQAERRELARDFVTLKHTISQLRAERDRLAVENRDLQMRLAAIEADYANLFSYVEGRKGEA
jgi:ABC-type phosphate transport system auxiliary subunit